MSFWIMLLTMGIAGTIGGIINYLLPANNPKKGEYLKPVGDCILLGLGATLLVPLFLEIAQSKLMDDIRFDKKWVAEKKETTVPVKDTLKIIQLADTGTRKVFKSDTTTVKGKTNEQKNTGSPNTGKSYLLWSAYCLLAAAAGFRFINMLIKNVVKEEEVKALKNENQTLLTEKQLEGQRNKINAQRDEKKATEILVSNQPSDKKVLPVIGSITVPDDPQKGRFGGKSVDNNRQIRAEVTKSTIPDFFDVKIWVESTDPTNHPLQTDCIFYIHDSFRPSVYPVKVKNGIAIDDDILSYGAFTVGVVTDNGETLLELDLAEQKDFPKKFRER